MSPSPPHTQVCCAVLSHVWLWVSTWTVARQAPLSMGFSRQEYCSGCRARLQGIFPTQELNPWLLHLLHCGRILYCWATGGIPTHKGISCQSHWSFQSFHNVASLSCKFPMPEEDSFKYTLYHSTFIHSEAGKFKAHCLFVFLICQKLFIILYSEPPKCLTLFWWSKIRLSINIRNSPSLLQSTVIIWNFHIFPHGEI